MLDIEKYTEESFVILPITVQKEIIIQAVQNLNDNQIKELHDDIANMFSKNGIDLSRQ